MKKPKLSVKQKAFVGKYLIDMNATRAYREVYGASQKVAEANGPRLLGNARVAAAIAKAQDSRAKRVEVTQDTVLREMLIVMRSDVRHFRVNEAGSLVLADNAPQGAWRAVSSVKHRRIVVGRGEDKETTYEIEFRLWDKPAAIRMAGQHLAMFTDKVEHSGAITLEDILTRSREK